MSARPALRPARIAAAGTLVLVLFASRPALAQGTDTVTAEALFQQGKALLSQNRFGEACPKFAESQRLDPATGTLMALALCHEGNGQLASAWAEYTDVESKSRKDGREDRQKLAHERANALRPRLSTLEVGVPPEVATLDGVIVKRNGQEIGRGVWNSAVPIDGGTHTIEASAPGKAAWKGSVTVKGEADRALLKIPPLKSGSAEVPAVVPAATAGATPSESTSPERPAAQPEPASSSGGLSATQWIGISAAGAGVVALGVGGYFLATALGEKTDSHDPSDPDYCDGTYCGDTGQKLRADAVAHGNVATVLGIAGGVLVAGGATLFLVGNKKGSDQGTLLTVRVSAVTAPGGASLRITGSF